MSTKPRAAGARATVAQTRKVANKVARRRLGPLRKQLVSVRTARRYEKALAKLFAWLLSMGFQRPSSKDEWDPLASEFIEYLWQEGDGRSLATDSLSGLQRVSPGLRGSLRGAWALTKAWQRCELPSRAPPFAPLVLLGVAEAAVLLGLPRVAAGCVVGAHCILRTGELCSITSAAVELATDLSSAVISLGDTKGGQRRGAQESAEVTASWVAVLLAAAMRGTSPGDLLFGTAAQFRKGFARALAKARLTSLGFRPYSLRRTGATELWRATANIGLVSLRGRWGSSTTARIYINDGLAKMAEFNLQGESFAEASRLGKCFQQRCGAQLALF